MQYTISNVSLFIFSARFIRFLSERASFDGIWLLCFFVYIYTLNTCFNILRCQKVTLVDQMTKVTTGGEYVSGHILYLNCCEKIRAQDCWHAWSTYNTDLMLGLIVLFFMIYLLYAIFHQRFYYDGTTTCFQSPHLVLAIIALLLGTAVAVLFPTLICVISFRSFKVILQVGCSPSVCTYIAFFYQYEQFLHTCRSTVQLSPLTEISLLQTRRYYIMDAPIICNAILYHLKLVSPLLHLYISLQQHTLPFTDVLNKGLKTSRRWWSGYDLLRRLLFIVVSLLFNYVNPSFTQVHNKWL